MFNCLIADGITRIRNGYKAQLGEIELVFSNFVLNFLRILKSGKKVNSDFRVEGKP